MTAAVAPKINKSEFVRGVLNEIGAFADPAPEGWKAKVNAALAKQNLTMHEVMIYNIRREGLKKAGLKKPSEKVKAQKVKTPKKEKSFTLDSSLTLNDLLSAHKFATEFGGVEKLSKALTAISSFMG